MTEHVLVADDSRQNRLVASGHLRAAGYRVTAVESGELALARLAVEGADLVVLDIVMPGLDGYETCRRIRATPAIADVPVLFLTALGGGDTARPAIDAGGDDLLCKPFNHAELLLRVRSLIRQRQQARRLAAQHEALRRISQMIVHDLRGPTAAIMGTADVLAELGLAGEAREMVDDIATAAAHLGRTIRDLLDLSTAEDVGLDVRMEAIAVGELAAEVASGLRGVGRSRRIAIECEIAPSATELIADRQLIRRMLQNLVHNAIKHSPPGRPVTIRAAACEGQLELSVLDHGVGVPEDERERIFERYVSSGSHGLGLAFCRLVAEAHGGRIWIEPRMPHGSVFHVVLPARTDDTICWVKRAPSAS
jgi:two-component system, sensor histidine kinase and response regulator